MNKPRTRTVLTGAGLVALALVALDFLIIALLLDDGLDMSELAPMERRAATQARAMTGVHCLDNPIAWALTRKQRIVEVVRMPGERLYHDPMALQGEWGPCYRVVIQTHTFWGFPWIRICDGCEAIACYHDPPVGSDLCPPRPRYGATSRSSSAVCS